MGRKCERTVLPALRAWSPAEELSQPVMPQGKVRVLRPGGGGVGMVGRQGLGHVLTAEDAGRTQLWSLSSLQGGGGATGGEVA